MGLQGRNRAERQMVRIQAPFGASVVKGTFVLAFPYGGLTERDPDKGKAKTDAIAFNASASDVKMKLEALDNIGNLQRVQRQEYPAVGGGLVYAWTITFDPDVHTGNVPTFKVVYHTLKSDAPDQSAGIVVSELIAGLAAESLSSLTHTVTGLEPYTNYEFQLQARNVHGKSSWGDVSKLTRTLAVVSEDISEVVHDLTDQKLVTASDMYLAANADDPDYVFGASRGGLNSSRGSDGIVVITAYSYGQQLVFADGQSRQTTFFYAEANGEGTIQTYIVPSSLPGNNKVQSVQIKAWGAGGGGGTAPQAPHNEPLSAGGGGGFAQGVFKVSEGDFLTIVVGGGGNGFKVLNDI